ncbi:hypothetical protein [Phenylobacterium sp.]|uniref:hypothetical protein n=1 Tax=Phenylobacterium sp. TaxID=1871053 RepID=UPI0019A7DA01|nr:hypothetical protein [Phenylobacterium sp.]MBC7166930.1 hypothetical protein [Phenylobacterium sp.]
MTGTTNLRNLLIMSLSAMALAACGGGASEVASPGEGAFPPSSGGGSGGGGGGGSGGSGSAASDCPTGFTNVGTIANNTLRNCQLPAKITGNLVVPLRAGTIYSISGRVDVGDDMGGDAAAPKAGAVKGTLTIEPGVKLFGSAGLDYIVVNRGSQIYAEGTSAQPIVFTSRQSVEGTTGVDSIGQWGGLVVLGRAPISNCPGTTAPGTANCEAQVEGTNAFYGGNSATDNSGVMKYVRVQHSGFQILPNNELNGITFAGVGSGTLLDYIQVHNSSDDGIEWFGGTVNAKHLVLTGNDDDSMDTDVGFNDAIQFAIVVQRANGGDRGNEASGSNRTPASNPKFANVTMVGRGSSDVIVMNSGTNNVFANSVFTASGTTAACLDIDDTNTTGSFNSVFFSCPVAFRDDSNVGATATQAIFAAGANNTANGTSTLTSTFINGANENAVPAANLTSISSFFTNTTYIGAVRNSSDTWWQGWTCGLTSGSSC